MSEEIIQRVPEARELTPEELNERVSTAFQADQAIKETLSRTRTDMWELAARFHHWDENKLWRWLGGYDTLNDWLAEPEIGVSRSVFFDLRKAWEELVVLRGVDIEELKGVEWTKVRLMLPAISNNKVDVQTAFDDARSLGWADVREKYCKPRQPKDPPAEGDPPDVEGKARTVDAPDSEPVKLSDVSEAEATHDANGEPRYGHFDEPPGEEPQVGRLEAEVPGEPEPETEVDVWDWVRCPCCSGLFRLRDAVPAEPEEVEVG